ncbi:MAG: hypothetical protein AAGA77_05385 [Bacteroidota bacterium]
MKNLPILFILFYSPFLLSQSFELHGGLLRYSLFDTNTTTPNHGSIYSTDYSGYFGIGLNQIQISDFELSVALTYEKFGGDVFGSIGGRGGGQ